MIAIISDIHGNYPALKAVIEDIEKYNINTIYSLGDVAGYYCMINECINLLREKKVINIFGNHDLYVVNNKECPRSTTANFCLTHQRNIITPNNLAWLSESIDNLSIDNSFLAHGGLKNYFDEYIYQVSENYLTLRKERFIFVGHTHVQKKIIFTNQYFINPGSVGQPRDGDPRAAYAIKDDNDIILRRVEYDINHISDEMKSNNFDERTYSNLRHGTRIGGKIDKIIQS